MIQNNFLQNELIYILYILEYEDIEEYKQYLIERIRTLILKLDYEKWKNIQRIKRINRFI